jgi:hypothetical protein
MWEKCEVCSCQLTTSNTYNLVDEICKDCVDSITEKLQDQADLQDEWLASLERR